VGSNINVRPTLPVVRMNSNRAHLVWMSVSGALLGQKCKAYVAAIQNGWEVTAQPDGVSVEVTYVTWHTRVAPGVHSKQVGTYRKALESRGYLVQPLDEGTRFYRLQVQMPDAWCEGIEFTGEQEDAAAVQP
jgi:hypothetical protein